MVQPEGFTPLSYHSRRSDVVGLNPAGTWRRTGEGLFASPMAEGAAFLKSDPAQSDPAQSRPDLQLHFVVGIVDEHLRRLHLANG